MTKEQNMHIMRIPTGLAHTQRVHAYMDVCVQVCLCRPVCLSARLPMPVAC